MIVSEKLRFDHHQKKKHFNVYPFSFAGMFPFICEIHSLIQNATKFGDEFTEIENQTRN